MLFATTDNLDDGFQLLNDEFLKRHPPLPCKYWVVSIPEVFGHWSWHCCCYCGSLQTLLLLLQYCLGSAAILRWIVCLLWQQNEALANRVSWPCGEGAKIGHSLLMGVCKSIARMGHFVNCRCHATVPTRHFKQGSCRAFRKWEHLRQHPFPITVSPVQHLRHFGLFDRPCTRGFAHCNGHWHLRQVQWELVPLSNAHFHRHDRSELNHKKKMSIKQVADPLDYINIYYSIH